MAWQPKGNIRGPQGATGQTGATGTQGPAGLNGERWFSGTIVPTTVSGAVVGDWYLLSTTGDFYECTGTNAWTVRGNLKGPTGNTGATGAQGAQGVQGNTGATGSQGAQGVQGPQGIQGPIGPEGPPGGATVLFNAAIASIAAIAGATGLGKMGGLACYFTPTKTGTVLINMCGNLALSTTGVIWGTPKWGTGNAPAFGASAAAYQNFIGALNASYGAPAGGPFAVPAAFHGSLVGLTLGVRCWVDMTLTNTGGVANVSMSYPCVQIIEL